MRTTPRGKQYDRELVCLHQVLIYDSDGDGDDDDDGDEGGGDGDDDGDDDGDHGDGDAQSWMKDKTS